jgi:hypothetical protein
MLVQDNGLGFCGQICPLYTIVICRIVASNKNQTEARPQQKAISHNVQGLRRFLWRNKETRSVSRHKKCAVVERGSGAT